MTRSRHIIDLYYNSGAHKDINGAIKKIELAWPEESVVSRAYYALKGISIESGILLTDFVEGIY